MRVDRPQVPVILGTPNLVEQLFTREHFLFVRDEQIEQIELFPGQVDRFAFHADRTAIDIDRQDTGIECRFLFFREVMRPTKRRFDSGEQLSGLNGFVI